MVVTWGDLTQGGVVSSIGKVGFTLAVYFHKGYCYSLSRILVQHA